MGRRLSGIASRVTTLIISNEEMNDIMKIIKSIKESGFLTKGVGEIIKNEAKKQKGGFFRMLLGTLGASLLRNLLTGKRAITMSQRRDTIKADKGTFKAVESTVRAGQDFQCCLIL